MKRAASPSLAARPEPGARTAGWRAVAVVLGLLAVALHPSPAAARSTTTLPYPSASVWAAAVRHLRVDRGYLIREKDEASGYVLFDYVEGSKSYRAAVELVPLVEADGRASTRVSLSITGLPKRYEGALLDGLAAKVRDERGPPPEPPRRPARDDTSEKERPREKDRERTGAKATAPPESNELPRIPTLPSP